MKFAIAALLGSASAYTADTKPVWGLRSVLDHRVDAGNQKEYGVASTEAANARPPQQSHVQVEDSDSSSDSDSDDDFV